MATQSIPANPSLKSLKNQAKQLLHAHRAGKNEDCQRIKASHPRLGQRPLEQIKETDFALADAQLVVAREYGYQNWRTMTEMLFVPEKHFANEPGWNWLVSPNLDHAIGTSGGIGSMHYENHVEDSALYVSFAVRARTLEKNWRAVGFDDDGNRHELKHSGSFASSKENLALFAFKLPYSDVPHNVVRYLGIEQKKTG
ncbi:MAG: hypothetical protein GKR89_11160 [Candidatus Latescibacteria bacterium]|nr:hypothetical protein [Candidatus Latescibacterota bacterium]